VAKANLLARIQELDRAADGLGLDEDGWALCCSRGGAKTKFFHAFANGRKRKCAILSLVSDNGLVTEKGAI
jgi:hypothetical protein